MLQIFYILLSLNLCFASDVTKEDPSSEGSKTVVVDKHMVLIGAVINATFSIGTGEKGLQKDQIAIHCNFKESACLGAKVILKDESGTPVDNQVISSLNGVLFTKVKKQGYRAEIEYPRFKVKNTSDRIEPGHSLTIVLTEEKSAAKGK